MIEFHYQCDFELSNELKYTEWLKKIVDIENCSIGTLAYIFCDDKQLLKINKEYLDHDDFTDIITFDYGDRKIISGDIFISIERVWENALKFDTAGEKELLRVMSHGVLHLMGYNDKTEEERSVMREKENEKIDMFHVEQ
ncbi:MAG: rRNA maturation RNase YbeY [Muriicola sp.]|nr:rRNA maturation RNase YbeY [Muriicola sp.]